MAGLDRTRQGMAGLDRTWQGMVGHDMASQGMLGVAHMAGSYHSYESSLRFFSLPSGAIGGRNGPFGVIFIPALRAGPSE